MSEDLSGFIRKNNQERALPIKSEQTSIEEEIKEWNENPKVKENGVKIVNRGWHGFLTFFFVLGIISAMGGGGYFLYLVKSGKFQTEINTQFIPQINNTNINNYDFTPLTTENNEYKNYNNYTIINNIKCPTP